MTRVSLRHLAPPPRMIPVSVRTAVLLDSTLQGCLALLGIALGLGLFIAARSEFPGSLRFRGPLERAEAVIQHVEKAGFSEGGRRGRSGRPVYAVHYQFTDSQGRVWKDLSYGAAPLPEVGARVPVHFPAGRPEYSRIIGLRRGKLRTGAAVVWLIPIVVLGFAAGILVRNVRAVRLLERGELAEGELIDHIVRERRGAKGRSYSEHLIAFQFQAGAGEPSVYVMRTADEAQVRRVLDDPREWILYYPGRSRLAATVDTLPGRPTFDERGALQPRSAADTLARLILPSAVLVLLALCIDALRRM